MWSYGEWSEWTNFREGTRSRMQTLFSLQLEELCPATSLEEYEVAVCQGSIISLKCNENEFMEVTALDYGPTNECFYTCSEDQDCLANALEDIQRDCNSRQSCELQDSNSLWNHFASLSSTLPEEMQGRLFEMDINLDVTYECHASYVQQPESGKSGLVEEA